MGGESKARRGAVSRVSRVHEKRAAPRCAASEREKKPEDVGEGTVFWFGEVFLSLSLSSRSFIFHSFSAHAAQMKQVSTTAWSWSEWTKTAFT